MRLKFSQRNRFGRDGRATGASKKTLYDFLGLDPGAGAQTLKRALRKMVKEHRPDLHHDPAASQRTKVLIAAHELPSDPKQRAAYDQRFAQLHEPPLPSEWQRKIICGASTVVCLSFALVSAWKVSFASTHQVTSATQDRPCVETAGRDLPRDYSITREAQAATAASSGAASPESQPISASNNDSKIAESDDLDRIIADLDRAIQRTPDDAQVYRDRAYAWARKGDMDRALADYEQAIRIDPNNPAIFHDRGLIWERKREFNKAIVDFDHAVRMSFTDPELYCDRGAAWFEKGRLDRALADFNQALKINPRLATAYVRRAVVFERKGDQERARADREQATRLGDAGKAVTASNRSTTKIAESISDAGVSTHSSSRTTLDQVAAATALAERVTTATSVVILIARPEIKSVSDLAGKSIAIDRAQSASSSSVRIAIVRAGAAEIQLTESQTRTALDRVIGEEVPAAVLTLASQEAAEGFPEIAGFNTFRIPITLGMSLARIGDPQPATDATAASAAAATTIANLHPTGAAPDTSPTIQELARAATTVAERMTAALAASQSSEQKTNRTEHPERSEIDDSEKVTAVRSIHPDPRIAILMTCSAIKSVTDLAGKGIAIDEKQSASSDTIRAAIAAAGAAEVQMSEGQGKAIDRLILAEVPAAVLAVVSREAAEAFPEMPGFNIFRIPITSGMSLARIRDPQPATDATAASAAAATTVANLRPTGAAPETSPTIQDLVTAATTVAERMTVALAASQSSEERSEIDDAEKVTAVRSIHPDPRIVILMARSAIKSVTDLAGKEIAIDEKQSASSGTIRTAVAAAGAAEVQVSEGQGKAIDRLILAEVPAAVLAVVSREAAEAFPEMPSFRIFRIPLSPPGLSNEDSQNRSR